MFAVSVTQGRSNEVEWPTNTAAGAGGSRLSWADREIDPPRRRQRHEQRDREKRRRGGKRNQTRARSTDAFGDADNLGIRSSVKSLCPVITVKPSTVPAGWLRSRCQITNIGARTVGSACPSNLNKRSIKLPQLRRLSLSAPSVTRTEGWRRSADTQRAVRQIKPAIRRRNRAVLDGGSFTFAHLRCDRVKNKHIATR